MALKYIDRVSLDVFSGVSSFPNVSTMFSALQVLRQTDIACSFVQIGHELASSCSLGNVTDSELLHFFATSSGGGLVFLEEIMDRSSPNSNSLGNNSVPSERLTKMSLCHQLLLATPLYVNDARNPTVDKNALIDLQIPQEVIVGGPGCTIFANTLDASVCTPPVPLVFHVLHPYFRCMGVVSLPRCVLPYRYRILLEMLFKLI